MAAVPVAEGPTPAVARRAQLAERWQRAITATGAVPYSAAEVREQLLQFVDGVFEALDGNASDDVAVRLGCDLVRLGFRSLVPRVPVPYGPLALR